MSVPNSLSLPTYTLGSRTPPCWGKWNSYLFLSMQTSTVDLVFVWSKWTFNPKKSFKLTVSLLFLLVSCLLKMSDESPKSCNVDNVVDMNIRSMLDLSHCVWCRNHFAVFYSLQCGVSPFLKWEWPLVARLGRPSSLCIDSVGLGEGNSGVLKESNMSFNLHWSMQLLIKISMIAESIHPLRMYIGISHDNSFPYWIHLVNLVLFCKFLLNIFHRAGQKPAAPAHSVRTWVAYF